MERTKLIDQLFKLKDLTSTSTLTLCLFLTLTLASAFVFAADSRRLEEIWVPMEERVKDLNDV